MHKKISLFLLILFPLLAIPTVCMADGVSNMGKTLVMIYEFMALTVTSMCLLLYGYSATKRTLSNILNGVNCALIILFFSQIPDFFSWPKNTEWHHILNVWLLFPLFLLFFLLLNLIKVLRLLLRRIFPDKQKTWRGFIPFGL